MASDSYNIISICAGYGGLDLAVGLAVENARTICHVEREAQAAAGLASRMEDRSLHEAPIWSDLSTFDGKPWHGLVDCIISGDPCQPNSVAGSQRGSEDDRFLIDELIRVVKEVRPSRVFRENVTGNADGQIAALIPALEELGYRVAAGIFSAGEVGASHRRERLFIMADAKSDTGARLREREEQEQPKLSGRSGDVVDASRDRHRSGREARDISEEDGRQDGECLSLSALSSDVVANAQSLKRGMGEAKGREPQKHTSGRGGELAHSQKLADANGGRRRSRGGEPLGKQHLQPESSGDNGERQLADAVRSNDQGQQSGQHDSSRREVKVGQAGLCSRTRFPIFAPGPSDVAWQSILSESPFLAPSLAGLDLAEGSFSEAADYMGEANQQEKAKSLFRRMAHGLAPRVDRLRGGGNGVCSMAGAVAWLSLANHFEEVDE